MNYQIITLIVGSALFALLALIASLWLSSYIGKHSKPAMVSANRSIGIVSVIATSFCMWLMWICTYLHQMNPIISPVLKAH